MRRMSLLSAALFVLVSGTALAAEVGIAVVVGEEDDDVGRRGLERGAGGKEPEADGKKMEGRKIAFHGLGGWFEFIRLRNHGTRRQSGDAWRGRAT